MTKQRGTSLSESFYTSNALGRERGAVRTPPAPRPRRRRRPWDTGLLFCLLFPAALTLPGLAVVTALRERDVGRRAVAKAPSSPMVLYPLDSASPARAVEVWAALRSDRVQTL